MDDVDRLFECFKCGISPPQSALRERKRIKSKSNQRSKAQEVDSPRSPEQIKKIASYLQLSAQKLCNTEVVPFHVEEKDIDPDACHVCLDKVDHFDTDCPYLDRIPPGAVLGPLYDYVCIGCGKIGETCCAKGAYDVRRRCACPCDDHWLWERRCPKDWRRPSSIPELPSIQELEEEVMKKKNKNKEEDEVMVNVRKDIKYMDAVMVEDDKNSIKDVPSTEQSLEKSLQACCFTGP